MGRKIKLAVPLREVARLKGAYYALTQRCELSRKRLNVDIEEEETTYNDHFADIDLEIILQRDLCWTQDTSFMNRSGVSAQGNFEAVMKVAQISVPTTSKMVLYWIAIYWILVTRFRNG